MSANSSNASLHPRPLPSDSNVYQLLHECMKSRIGVFSSTAFTIAILLFLLPFCIQVVYLGYRRWRRQRSATAMSHSDFFTYNMVIAELMTIVAFTLSCCAIHSGCSELAMLGIYLCAVNYTGQIFFHLLTCVERYLAVVHPVTYLGLRNVNGIRLRNITIGCIWLVCFAGPGVIASVDQVFVNISQFVFLAFSVAVVFFCSIAVACALIRPGPGERGGDRQQIHKSKLRPFYTIVVILVVLLVRFGGNIVSYSLYYSPHLDETARCGLSLSGIWFILPSSFVLPLLYLHRAGKLSCCKNQSDQGSD